MVARTGPRTGMGFLDTAHNSFNTVLLTSFKLVMEKINPHYISSTKQHPCVTKQGQVLKSRGPTDSASLENISLHLQRSTFE